MIYEERAGVATSVFYLDSVKINLYNRNIDKERMDHSWIPIIKLISKIN